MGSGYHLITNAEWTSLARHIAAQPSNWSTGTVGSGVLSRGYSASTTFASDGFENTAVAPSTGPGYEYNTGVNTLNSFGDFIFKRTNNLQNGQIIWDLAGNVWEWNSDTCVQGSGVGNWYNTGGVYIEWNDANLDDYERGAAGYNSSYTSAQGIGKYSGCVNNGNGLARGGHYYCGLMAGAFAFSYNGSPSFSRAYLGFRCTR
ncbi:MAG: hypothetical protein BWY21_00914 [Parcubacteria group bacterium ADurb.Bin216]|nr:MAG: hypothetical protein BWY21_00914 [Parcubacteria group bacterium ADurb.Bin216]